MSRSEAFIRVECDFCGKTTEEFPLYQPMEDYPAIWVLEGGEEARLLNAGWTSTAIGDQCPACTNMLTQKEAALWPPNQLPPP